MYKQKPVIYGEIALVIIVIMNSFAVDLMLYSGSGISAISSVPYAISEILPFMSLGTWTYAFQFLLVMILMLKKRKLVPSYLFSFVVGFAFSMMLDVHQIYIHLLPHALPLDILYFIISYLMMSFGIALSNHCLMPIIPTDLFPRDFAALIKCPYAKVKITFDVSCLCFTCLSTWICLGNVKGLGIGTVIAAFTMGKAVALFETHVLSHVSFNRYFHPLSLLKHSA